MLLQRAFLSFVLFFLIVPSGVVLLPERASAAAFGLVPCALKENNPATSWNEQAPCTLCHFMIGLNEVVKLIRNIMTAIAIAVIVAMAIVYITSAGDEGRMSFAKEGIKWSLIGFAVILLAWVAVNFLFTLPIFSQNGLVRTNWDTLSCNTTSQSLGGRSNTVAVRPSSGISNASGSASSGPSRGEAPGPGAQGPVTGGGGTGGTGSGGGTGGSGGGGTGGGGDTGGGGTGIPITKCGGVHYTCDEGTPINPQQLNDRWIWGCQKDWKSSFCIERFEGCGDGKVSGLNQYGNPEQCDEGGRNGCGEEGGGICSASYCTLCDGSYVPPAPLACGASHGSTSNSPPTQLCTGEGAVASSVTTSAVGSGTRYDWTCAKDNWEGYGTLNCSSGRTNDTGGNTTATCGPAVGVASATQPRNIDLCVSPGYLDIYGVKAMIHAQTGEPIWNWGCQMVSGGAQTTCIAPRIVN